MAKRNKKPTTKNREKAQIIIKVPEAPKEPLVNESQFGTPTIKQDPPPAK